ncbi:MAG: GspE/PulE family protein [Alphaproteobacteria bacterium]|nr:GspE/PulE family protein [Alphaproteobacteria bacterium]
MSPTAKDPLIKSSPDTATFEPTASADPSPGASDTLLLNYLTQNGLLSTDDARKLDAVVRQGEQSPIAALRRLGKASRPEFVAAIAAFYQLETVGDDEWPERAVLADRFSWTFLREATVLPLAASDDEVVLAVADPGRTKTLDSVRLAAKRSLSLRLAAYDAIEARLELLRQDSLVRPAGSENGHEDVSANAAAGSQDEIEQLKDLATGAPVVHYVNDLLAEAVRQRATDLHIETFRDKVVVRARIDGILRAMPPPAATMARAVASRIKILAGLNIAERRLPQDGHAVMPIDQRQLDVRVATVPTVHGEAIALRFLDNLQQNLDFHALGLSEGHEKTLRRHLEAPYGLFLVTGPTGSGKTTTLATALSLLNEPHRKILSVEDPVEIQIEGVNQTQVKPEIGVTFASVLRSFLRHDPEVIMVGEMRDAETARIGIHAALTGHLVLSTLHTNSAAGAVSRLLDMGCESFLMASSLRCVIGQRLVRVLCPNCRQSFEAAPELPEATLAAAGLSPTDRVVLYRAQAGGCSQCSHSGYRGRIGLFEILDVTQPVQELIRPGVTAQEVERRALELGLRPMIVDGLEKCRQGLTTLEEVRRVTLDW